MSASEHVEVLRAAHSSIYRILAELASGGQTDEQCEKELMQRPFVMDRVVRIRQALDKIGAALSAEPVGVGKCNGCGHIHPLGETGDALHKLQSLVDSHGDTGHENALDTLDGVIRRLAQPQHCPKCKFTMSGVGYCVNCQPQRQGEQWKIGFFDRWNEHAKKLGYAGMAEALTDLGEIKQRQGEAVGEEAVARFERVRQASIREWEKSTGPLVSMNRLEACRVGMRAVLQAIYTQHPAHLFDLRYAADVLKRIKDSQTVPAEQVSAAYNGISYVIDRTASTQPASAAVAVAVAERVIAHLDEQPRVYLEGSGINPENLAAAMLAAAPEASGDTERCESGDPACGPVEFYDSEGVPLCKVCWEGLLADSAAAAPEAKEGGA